MAGRYVMTPARRAALKKAQAASARKRKGSGKGPVSRKGKFKARRAKVKSVKKEKKAYAKKNYKGKGGYANRFEDMRDSKGPVYSKNRKGKKFGKTGKRVNKAAAYYSVSPVALAVSRKRRKSRGKGKKKK